MDDSNKRLIPFLRGLADRIEAGEVNDKQLMRVGEFFMAYEFQQQAMFDGEEDDREGYTDIPMTDIVKFIVMGFHVYRNLLMTERLSG